MADIRTIQNSFNAGEWSPLMEGRSDLAKYRNAAKTIENFMCLKQGGISRRPGTRFVAEVKDSTAKTRLIPFVFSEDQVYVLELGNLYGRVYKDGAQLTRATGSILTSALSPLFASGSGYVVNDTGTFGNGTGATYIVTSVSSGAVTGYTVTAAGTGYQVGIVNGMAGGAQPGVGIGFAINILTITPLGTGPVTFVMPYLTAELFDIHFCQSADVIYLAHSSHVPRTISRASDTSWTCALFNYANHLKKLFNGPFLDDGTIDAATGISTSLTPSGVSGSITLTASNPIFTAAMATREGVSGVDGIPWIISQGATDTIVMVMAFIDASNLTVVPQVNLPDTTASTGFREAAWSDYRGFPSTVTFFQQRLWWAGNTFQPDTMWGSQTSNYANYFPGTGLDDEACTFTLASNKINMIEWIAPSRSMLVGTAGQEWQVTGDAIGNPITPSAVDAIPETTYGSCPVSPIQVSYATLFLQRHNRRLREYTYSFTSDSYDAPDLTILAEHISIGGFTQMDYQQELDSIVWCVRADGTLCGLTYERPQDVVAWHRQVTNGRFESVAVIPNPNADEDQVWVIVNRTIGGVTKRYVEYLDTQGGYYGKLGVDCGLTYPPSTTNIISISTAEFTLPGPPISVDTRATYYAPGHGLSPAGTVVIAGTNPSAFSGSFTVETTPDEDHFTIVFAGADMPVSGTGGSFPPIGATSTLTGLSHLEGQMVDILGNGAVYASQIVTGGQVTGLSPQVTRAEVGLHFDSTLLTMRPEAGGDNGETAQGGRKRFSSVIVRLDSSIGVTINEEQVELRTPDDPMDGPVPLFTGDVKAANLGWDTDARIMVKQTQPLPLTVLCIIGDLDVNES